MKITLHYQGSLVKIADTLRKATIVEASELNQFAINDSLIKHLFSEINILDTITITTDNELQISTLRATKLQQIALLMQYNKQTTIKINAVRNTVANYAESINENLNTNGELIIENHKAVNRIIIQHDVRGNDTISEDEFQTLIGIATQCPYEGGQAVFEARVKLLQLSDTIYWDDNAACAAAGYYRAMIKNNEPIVSAYITPNPAQDEITIIYPFQKENNYSIEVYDAIGKRQIVLAKQGISTMLKLNTTSLKSACYNYRILENKKLVATGKFSIIK